MAGRRHASRLPKPCRLSWMDVSLPISPALFSPLSLLLDVHIFLSRFLHSSIPTYLPHKHLHSAAVSAAPSPPCTIAACLPILLLSAAPSPPPALLLTGCPFAPCCQDRLTTA